MASLPRTLSWTAPLTHCSVPIPSARSMIASLTAGGVGAALALGDGRCLGSHGVAGGSDAEGGQPNTGDHYNDDGEPQQIALQGTPPGGLDTDGVARVGRQVVHGRSIPEERVRQRVLDLRQPAIEFPRAPNAGVPGQLEGVAVFRAPDSHHARPSSGDIVVDDCRRRAVPESHDELAGREEPVAATAGTERKQE